MKRFFMLILISNLSLLSYLTDADIPVKVPGEPVTETFIPAWDIYIDQEFTKSGLPQSRHYYAKRDQKSKKTTTKVPPKETLPRLKPTR